MDTRPMTPAGLKPKDLVGIPWRVAFALQAEGWYLRSDIIWHKPNPMPESVTDRPTKAHEYLFLLSKSERYFYDQEAIKEDGIAMNLHDATGQGWQAPGQLKQTGSRDKQRGHSRPHDGFKAHWDKMSREEQCAVRRNKRDVWTIGTQPFPDAHFAVMPEALVIPCVLAGSPEGGLVLDPFTGSGTVGVVALKNFRRFVGIELNPAYTTMATRRIASATPGPALFNQQDRDSD
jgi:DNA modification methylase